MFIMACPEDIWIKFFTDAGLPSDIGATYALTFIENRIRMNMLLDLNKEYLREMGITCMGDVIAILRHAKKVHEETARDRVLASSATKIPIAAVAARPGHHNAILPSDSYTQRLAVTGRNPSPVDCGAVIKEKLVKIRTMATKRKIIAPDTADIKIESQPATTLVSKVKKINLNHNSVHDTKNVSLKEKAPSTAVSTVFARLGSNEQLHFDSSFSNKTNKFETIKSEGNASKTVFARLGGKQSDFPEKNTFDDEDGSSKFTSALKNSQPNKIIIKTNGAVRTLSNLPSGGTMQADKSPVNIRQKLPMMHPQRKTVKFSPHVDCKLIEKPASMPIQKSIAPKIQFNARAIQKSLLPKVNFGARQIQGRDVKKTAVAIVNKNNNVKLRLGNVNPINNNTNKVGVFSRLG